MINLKLKFAILKKYESQNNFCSRTGYNPDRLSKIIHGKRKPASSDLIHFEATLNQTAHNLGLCLVERSVL